MSDAAEIEPQGEPAQPPPAPVEKEKTVMMIPMEGDALAPTNHSHLVAFIRQMIEAKALPKHLTTVPEVLSAWNYAAQLKLPPQPSLRNIAIIEGTPSLFGDLPLSLVQRHKDYMWHDEFVADKEYKRISFENKNLGSEIFTAVFIVMRKGMKEPKSFSFTVEDMKNAGLGKLQTKSGNDTVWKKYFQDMLIRKARIRGIRTYFADALCGAGIAEEFNYAPDMDIKDVTPPVDRANSLNAQFSRPV